MPSATEFAPLRTNIAGIAVNDLAARFGTPTFVYDAAKIIERIEDLRSFDVIRYAQKACSNIAIVDLVRRHGVLVDAVSAGEIRRALAAGYKPEAQSPNAAPPIVYTADIFDRESLDLVVEKGIHANCGSPGMIDQLGQRAPGRHISLRINPGFGHGHSQKTNTGGEQSKHGIWHADVADCLRRADTHGLGVNGLHMHIGSGTDLEHLRHVCQAMEKTARDVGRSLTNISAGGGLPVPYKSDQTYVDLPAYFELWDATRKRLEDAFGHKLTLEIEPGRYLVAESGYLITEIRTVKRMGDNTFYLLDAGFNNLARPILYGAYHPMSIVPRPGSAAEPTAARRRGRRTALRIRRHFHSARRGLRLHPSITRRRSWRQTRSRSRRRLRLRHGQQLQQQATGRRSSYPKWPGRSHSPPPNLRRSNPRRANPKAISIVAASNAQGLQPLGFALRQTTSKSPLISSLAAARFASMIG